jgi:hypothetical protein
MTKVEYALGQGSLPGFCEIENELNLLSESGAEERGAIYTKREVVEFILDLVGYRSEKRLEKTCLLEPSFGEGDFLCAAAERLLSSYFSHDGDIGEIVTRLRNCIRAVELHSASYRHTYEELVALFTSFDVPPDVSQSILDCWLLQGDFLLSDLQMEFTHVVGNPPYIRQEMVPDRLMAEYRKRYKTIFDRADLYIPFIEQSLLYLAEGGQLGFICADRWLKNRYGRKLRSLIAESFRLRSYVDMVGTEPFHSEVTAYPAVFVIARERSGPTRIALRPRINGPELKRLANQLTRPSVPAKSRKIRTVDCIGTSDDPWLLDRPDQLKVVRQLEDRFPLIEAAGCKIGIGVATGADRAYIGNYDELDVESDRKLPLVMTKDIDSGHVKWRGFGIVNPFSDAGNVVDLDEYPRLRSYFESRKSMIVKRNVAKRNPKSWFRTIDRIYPELAQTPKLLIPDIKGDAHIVYESGSYYPHHNLYYIVSDEWDLHALQAVLRSGIARLFVSVYSTEMRGGYLRFQAQYLRRICLPAWTSIDSGLKDRLTRAGESGDTSACDSAVFDLYNLSESQRKIVRRSVGR